MSRIYLAESVWDAALARMRYVYREFDNVMVNYSGGKDSTVILGLAKLVAAEFDRLPVDVLFVDQEAEWTSTITLMREIAADPDVRLHWLQCPLQIFNATSEAQPWLWCWEEGGEDRWLRPKEPQSIHDNTFGTTRFTEMFDAARDAVFNGDRSACINGVRCEESPARAQGLTSYACYEHVTWGNRGSNNRVQQPVFSPIYDWSYLDVWKAIHEHGWPYNELYDLQYQHGVSTQNMRVSSLHHETALRSLEYAHEVDGDLWNKLIERLQGVNSAKQMESAFRAPPSQLPPMFADWREYRDYLLEHLIENVDNRETLRKQFAGMDGRFVPEVHVSMWKMHVGCILNNDYHGTKMSTWSAANGKHSLRAGSRTKKSGFYNDPGDRQEGVTV